MERLFQSDSMEMLKELEKLEKEMIEDSYADESFGMEKIMKNAKDYITAVFDFMKMHYREEFCTVLQMITELYRIAATGEYTYLQDITDIGYKHDIFKKVNAEKRSNAMKNTMNYNSGDGRCVVFLDEVDKIINYNHDSRGESVNAMIQQQLLSSLAGTEVIEGVDTCKVLFILGGAFPRIDDLKKERKSIGFNSEVECKIDIKESIRDQIIAIGAEVEFVGRIEDIVKMSKLTRADLKAILMDENIGAFSKKREIYKASGMDLFIEEDTIDAIVDLIEKESAGARGVKNIMNQFADNQYFYDMKVGGYDTLRIHKGMLQGEKPIFLKEGVKNGEDIKYS